MKIQFDNFNYRRWSRGAPAAQFKIIFDDDPDGTTFLWMSKKDIKRNIVREPESKDELEKGLEAYSNPGVFNKEEN